MATFLWPRLLFGHLLGDFALQTDAVYEVKRARPAGLWIHVAITVASLALATFPYLARPLFVVALLGLGLVHFGLDRLKLVVARRHPENFFFFLIDQTLHIGSLALFALLPVGTPALGTDLPVYGNTTFFAVLTAVLAASFGLDLLLRTFSRTFLGASGTSSFRSRLWDYFWRCLTCLLVLAGTPWAFAAPAGLALGLVTHPVWKPGRPQATARLLVGFIAAGLIGLAFGGLR